MEAHQVRGGGASGEVRPAPRTAYRTPAQRVRDVEAVVDRIRRADQVVLTTHINADGDGAGCQAALAHWLDREGIRTWILNPTPFPESYRFLLPRRAGVVAASAPEAEGVCYQADLGIVVDTSDKGRLGRVKPLFDPLPKVVIDHHPESRKPIEGLTLVDPEAAAAGELVYDLFLAGADQVTAEMAEALYVAILTDTGSFRFANASAACFRMAGDLVERGARPDQLHRRVYGSPPLRSYHLLRAALGTLEVDEAAGVGWMTVPPGDYRRLDAEPADLEGFVDYPRTIQGVDVGILLRELDDGTVKISFRSNEDVDVNAVARRFGGGGHARAAGAVVEGSLGQVRQAAVQAAVEAAQAVRNPTDGSDPRPEG